MKRKDEIDILKAFGIIFMIMGHQFYGNIMDQLIHSFHMPLFFIVSGFLYKKIEIRTFLYKRIRTLIIPYLSFAFIHLCISMANAFLAGDFVEKGKFFLYHIFVFNYTGIPICGAIWFLTAMFFVELIYLLIDTILPKMIYRIFVIVALAGCGLWLSMKGIRLPLQIDVAFVCLLFYFIGTICRGISEKNKVSGKYIIYGVIIVAFSSLIAFCNSSVDLRLAIYGNLALLIISSVGMTIGLYFFAVKMATYENFFVQELKYIGKNSIIYLAFNQLIILVTRRLVCDNLVLNYLLKLVMLVVIVALLHIVSNLFVKTKLKRVIGK